MTQRALRLFFALTASTFSACTDDAPVTPTGDAATDAPVDVKTPADAEPPVDNGPPVPVTTTHCTYEPLAATGNATGVVTGGTLRAGAAEAMLDLPVGSALGAYTARARFMGTENAPDARDWPYSGGFHSSTGVERSPRVRALALSAGGENVVILKADVGVADDSTTVDVATRLGPSFAGKVIIASSHTHSGWCHTVANELLGLGFSRPRLESRRRFVDLLVGTARRAIDAMGPARIGIDHDANFDPMNRVNRDRRGENDDLPNGRDRKDRDLFVIRVDRMDGTPVAMVPVFGMHGTIMGPDNDLASGDSSGGVEWLLEESFDRPVVVMHLQGAGGDVSPAGSGGIECQGQPVCYNFARAESVGHNAVEAVRAAWTRAGTAMTDRAEMEMVTRAVPLGPDWRTFNVRDGRLSYSPFDVARLPDGVVFNDGGTVASPIDEFNAPFGAALCGDTGRRALPSSGQMPGTFNIPAYQSCSRVEEAAPFLGPLAEVDIPVGQVPCATTRTLLSALRINEHLFVTMPGEVVTLLADRVRERSPVAGDHTIVLGYAQGHVGYILHPEDWLRGGFEPSINLWGPLEGEYLMERSIELSRLVTTPMRENAVDATGIWRIATIPPVAAADAAPRAGMVPTSVPNTMHFPSVTRGAPRPTSAQPDATVPRLGLARFVWIGEDPRAGTPKITLQREMTAMRNDFVPVTRRSGRAVQDGEVILSWTPDPLMPATIARTHYWVAEWQAVTSVGTVFPDTLSNRTGVPLGRYRFHIEGTGYMVDSTPFTVSVGALSVAASRMGTSLQVTVGYEARAGWRLLDFETDSNRLVPLRSGMVDVTITPMTGAPRVLRAQRTDAMGRVTLTMVTDVRTVQVTDSYGNTGMATP